MTLHAGDRNSRVMRAIGIVEIGLFIALALMWGSAFLLIKIAVADFSPVEIVFWRLLVSSLVLGFIFWRSGEFIPRGGRIWPIVAAVGLLGNAVPFTLVSWAETEVASSLAAILVATSPIVTAILIPLFVPNEVVTRWRVLGIFVGFVGVVALMGGISLDRLGENIGPKLALLGASVGYATVGVTIRRYQPLPALMTALGMNVAGFIFITPVALLGAAPFQVSPDWGSAAAVLGLGLLPSALASIFLVNLIARAGAGFTSTINYLVPLVATGMGVGFLGETVAFNTLFGLALILLGVWISSRQRRPDVPGTVSRPAPSD